MYCWTIAAEAAMNPLQQLKAFGQSIWVDDIRRSWLRDGTVRRWIVEDGVAGLTSNPAIFGKAIAEDQAYRAALTDLGAQGRSPLQIYEVLALQDVQAAADLFAPLHDSSGGSDGYVSLEVSPRFADDTEASMNEARRLWRAFDRPNAMIKIPATAAGVPVIRDLIGEGINVNATLIFGLHRYGEVVDAFLGGLEQRAARGQSLQGVASVASFFLSRIDTAVDARLDALARAQARSLRGGAAIACARLAYDGFREWTAGNRWRDLAARGARPQRLLWRRPPRRIRHMTL
jgi:transaldolase